MVAQELTLDSPAYEKFESGEIDAIRETFLGLWLDRVPDRRTKETAIRLAERFREVVRLEYGVHSERTQETLDHIGALLHDYLEKNVRPELIKIRNAQQNRRVLFGSVAGGASGLIVGGSIGYAMGGSAGALAMGAAIGLVPVLSPDLWAALSPMKWLRAAPGIPRTPRRGAGVASRIANPHSRASRNKGIP